MKQAQTVLIVDDERINRIVLEKTLKNEHNIILASSGKEAIEILKNTEIDLILLDIMMPDISGYEVCSLIKSDEKTKEIPIVFISAMNETGDETKGLKMGAIDYITKPIKVPIVKARVRNHLKLRAATKELKKLYSLALDANPMTELPGNNSIAKVIQKSLTDKSKSAVIYSDLDFFKAYNDKYGFANGDKIIIFTANILNDSINKLNIKNSFLGHIGGDDFVLLVPSTQMYEVTNYIKEKFTEVTKFYNEEDITKGFIESTNRSGIKQQFPIMTISMGGVDLSKNAYTQYIEVNDACAEVKKKAKTILGNSFFLDRRRE